MSQAERPHKRDIFASVYPSAQMREVACRFVSGNAVPDPIAEREVSDRLGRSATGLYALRIAMRLLPLLSFLLFVLALSPFAPFKFTRNDIIVLGCATIAGCVLAYASYRFPRFTVRIYLALWNLRPIALAAYFLLLLVPPALFDAVVLKRAFDGLLLIPMVGTAWAMYRGFPASPWLARSFPLVFVAMAAVPGFIFPPYYQGIAGWTADVNPGETVTLEGYQFVNDAGQRIWVSHTLFAPVTQAGRFAFAWSDKESKIGPISPFIMKAYRRAYPLLKTGYMPYQRYFGRFAYPPHTYATNPPDYSAFPPDRIVSIQQVSLTYDRAHKLVAQRIYSDYEVPKP